MKAESLLHKSVIFAYEARWLTFSIAVIISGLGIVAFQFLNIDAYPDISGTQVQIITPVPGSATEEVERQVTIPIERTMAGLARVEVIRSRSIFGLSLVQILFEEGTNDYWAREQVYQKMYEVKLPPGIEPTLGSLATAYGEIYRYELVKTDKHDPMELRTFNDWVVVPRLLRAKGVVEVANFGGLGKQYAIHVKPEDLMRCGVKLQEIVSAVQNSNSNSGGSILERGSSSVVIRGIGRVTDYKELENIFIKNSFGTQVFVKDIGTVVLDHLPRTGVFGKNDRDDGVEGIVRMRRGENPSIVLARIQEAITELNEETLPSNIRIQPFYDRSTLIHETLETVAHNTLLGITFVIITLFIFLGNIRMAMLVALTIPFSLLFALSLMFFSNIPISLLSVGSIDFGIIVDGAVIVSENIVRKYSERKRAGASESITLLAAKEVQKPMIFSMGIVIIAYTPLLSLTRIEGLLFRPMALTLCFALIGALIFALYLIPPLSALLFKNTDRLHQHKESRIFLSIQNAYDHILPRLLKYKKRVAASFLGFFIGLILIIIPNLGTEFLPYMDEGVFWLRTGFPEGISLRETSEYASEIRKMLLEFGEISYVTSQTGRNDVGTDPFPLDRIEFMVGLKPKSEWKQFKNKFVLEDAIRRKLKSRFPTLRMNLTQPIIDSVTEDSNGTSADLAVELLGPDMETLRDLAAKTVSMLKGIHGSVNVNIEQEGLQPQLQIRIDKKKLSTYRISATSVNNVVNTAIGGLPVSEINEDEKRFDILVKYAPEYRKAPQAIALLPVFNEQGEPIPLGQISEIRVTDGETIIARARGSRRITVRTDIRGRAQGDFVAEAQSKFRNTIQVPKGYKVEWLGMFENLSRARIHFGLLVPISLLLILLLLLFLFRSISLSMLVLLSVPFAATGSIVALFLRGMHLSVSVGVGFTTLFGIASMHGILLVSRIHHLQQEGLPIDQAILQGASMRLRPVLMTSFVAFMGLLPASLSTGIGSDIQRPIATVMVWGILSSTFLSLILLPVFYKIIQDKIKIRITV
ncbi:CusA/CzcA family heavy metal efflux RND transporter [Leptospira perolatii]|uniref:CusA/CzcA family heavy metal efflux RND transporter n=1 Tax=Leptospira perolatii TaxID=2023191 RepID=A0A2M9ZPF1_9LEPT|nr:CusA/CzcA family heavy metal efflux RND transporter [Leptospira perolatii]PJZ70704.1 CusA/CzcA family heavy metal efflux RND transporter [Leptospira perolatii]PJZ73914.1 CusA/CzcA family heavy metal efflux RND transporter [Leptospira perolatii]